ncbi:hypothetical protein ABZX88_34300 [Kitasatospora aureofaciens]|uniref:hypothetical protein n=1 Tax=Kitasatospora aureofaciens TaxID=1894 RepID=UPI0033B7B71C
MSTPENESEAAAAARQDAKVDRIHELMRKHTKPELLHMAYSLGLAPANSPEEWRKDEIATTVAELEQRRQQQATGTAAPTPDGGLPAARRELSEGEAAGVKLMHEAYIRWRDMPPARITLERRDAWIVMMGLQTARSHPGVNEQIAGVWEAAGRAIQEQLADNPELYAMAETGWHRVYDVDENGNRVDAGEGQK